MARMLGSGVYHGMPCNCCCGPRSKQTERRREERAWRREADVELDLLASALPGRMDGMETLSLPLPSRVRAVDALSLDDLPDLPDTLDEQSPGVLFNSAI